MSNTYRDHFAKITPPNGYEELYATGQLVRSGNGCNSNNGSKGRQADNFRVMDRETARIVRNSRERVGNADPRVFKTVHASGLSG